MFFCLQQTDSSMSQPCLVEKKNRFFRLYQVISIDSRQWWSMCPAQQFLMQWQTPWAQEFHHMLRNNVSTVVLHFFQMVAGHLKPRVFYLKLDANDHYHNYRRFWSSQTMYVLKRIHPMRVDPKCCLARKKSFSWFWAPAKAIFFFSNLILNGLFHIF